jgi:hypothetical protein
MLAHLAYRATPSRPRPFVLGLLALAATAMFAGKSFAADLMPLGRLEADSTGQVSKAETLPSGAIVSGVAFETSAAAIDNGTLSQMNEERGVLRDANRGTVHLGIGLTERLSLSLGVSGTYEHVKPEERDQLFPNAGLSVAEDGWRQNVKQTGFAGATLAMKVQVVDWQGIKLSLAPFVESGAGEQATYSLTRSVSPKAGWMTALSYGAMGVGDATINAGFRYRQPEEIGDLILRNEAFYRMALTAYATRDVGIFLAGEGRRLMVAKAGDLKDDKLNYLPKEAGEVTAGVSIKFEDVTVAAFGGSRVKGTNGFGYGRAIAGLQITTTLGNYRGNRPKHSFATEIERDEAAKAAAAKPAKVEAAPATAGEDYSEMIGDGIDPLQAVDGGTDFSDANKTMEANKNAKPEVSEDEKVESELKELRAAEEKAAAEREAIEKAEREESRRAALKQHSQDDELMKEWMQEAEADAAGLEGITTDEANWNGLED